jgi:hypothetical protein
MYPSLSFVKVNEINEKRMVTEFIMHENENMHFQSEVLKARDHLEDLSGDG